MPTTKMNWLNALMTKLTLLCICMQQISCASMLNILKGASLEAMRISKQNQTKYLERIIRSAKGADMHNLMNEQVEPCEDFYEFACGNWAKINPSSPYGPTTTNILETLSKGLESKVAKLLKECGDPVETEIDRKIRDFYVSCVSIQDQLYEYSESLHELIAEFGGMPALSGTATDDEWNEQNFDWLETVAKIARRFGAIIIIGIDISPDLYNNTVNRLYIGYDSLPLETKSVYLDAINEKYRYIYRKKVEQTLAWYLNIESQLAESTAREIVNFEIELARGLPNEGEDFANLVDATNLKALQQKYAPHIDIMKLVKLILADQLVNETVYEYAESYQINLLSVLQRTPKRIVANYIFYNLIKLFLLEVHIEAAQQEHECVALTKSYFAKQLDNMVYRKYNTEAIENDVQMIWQQIRETFQELLLSDKLNWIESSTRQYAIEKLKATRLEINTHADANFSLEYKELSIDTSNYIENVKNILELQARQRRARLNETPKPYNDAEEFSFTPVNVIIENKIILPVSILQPYYLWSDYYPRALKFGILGVLLGHELIHGFDDTGRKYDKHGNYYNWWDTKSTQQFNERTQCFREQYSKYKYAGRFLPQTMAQSENIADNGGLRLAYAAYLRWYEQALRSGENVYKESLPHMVYNGKQLFFISFAQMWCNDVHSSLQLYQISTDNHVPGKYRAIGTLSNFEEFGKKFQCAKGMPMRPLNTCEIY